ncbi:MAG: zinc metallopeptidase [Chitinophagaceae bacterium]|nr:MAG: zinc metallopeptidase [Chitinophagaceae bacterium]
MFYQGNHSILVISLLFMGLSLLVSSILKSRFAAYGKIPLRARLTGREVAEKMLRENGIYDVKVVSVEGFLSDHYNPMSRTINLSPGVFESASVAAAAIAAHETGHAVQHATAYPWLGLRSKLVPAVQFSSTISQWVLLLGLVLAASGNSTLLLVGIGLFALTVLFSLVTLPVEFDASRRALAWLNHTNVTTAEEYPKAKNALTWAAMTYVVAALASVVMLLQYISIFMGSRDRR